MYKIMDGKGLSEYITDEEKQEYLIYECKDDFFENLEQGIQELNEICLADLKKKKILICGGMIAFDKGLSDFMNNMQIYTGNLFLLSEVTAQYRRYTAERINFPFICTPHLLSKEMVLNHMDIPVTSAMINLYRKKRYIREAVRNLEGRHRELGKGYALAWSYYSYTYIEKLVNMIEPLKVILWNEFYAFHHIFCGVCYEKQISVIYMEFGCIPGTICIEEIGQQGESVVARKYRSFRNKTVTDMEINDAYRVLEFLKISGLNRNLQPDSFVHKRMFSSYLPGRKSILYAGQNDYESGLFPYTRKTAKYHSPVFKTTLEALNYLRLLAIKNNWNLIYKPHPLVDAVNTENTELEKIDSVSIIRDVNINALIDNVDLVVTILSQCAYIALIREKPVVMFGYTQLKRKQCIYEAYKIGDVEKKIQEALKHGFTQKQKEKFNIHVAQLLKYYLYDDNVERDLRFGKDLKDLSLE